jgi:hypothetical protein
MKIRCDYDQQVGIDLQECKGGEVVRLASVGGIGSAYYLVMIEGGVRSLISLNSGCRSSACDKWVVRCEAVLHVTGEYP